MRSGCVLVAPLDWGLGHATRCIPVINQLLLHQREVIIAGSGPSLSVLQREFPALVSYELPAYDPHYSFSKAMIGKMALQLGKFIRTIKKEHAAIQHIVKERKVQIIISDNRYGCWSPVVNKNIFITHQVNILMPKNFQWLGNILNHFNHRSIKKFDQCWIPDWTGSNNVTGKLSATNKVTVNYIGSLSRFSSPSFMEEKYNILILLSGPEPQRTLLEKIIYDQLIEVKNLTVAVVRGTKTPTALKYPDNTEVINFPSGGELQDVIESSAIVLARSGYSTMMDLARLRKKAIFIPTPGQTEQEYLAKRMEERGIAYFADQDKFVFPEALKKSMRYQGFTGDEFKNDLLGMNITQLLM